jgi:hypothetical protein
MTDALILAINTLSIKIDRLDSTLQQLIISIENLQLRLSQEDVIFDNDETEYYD